jgi:lipopolysaccharide biosynthesis glycosyltransferase
MKNIIYQYWDGNVRPSCRAGVENMKRYAKRIGAEHVFEDNPGFLRKMGLNFGQYTPHYGAFKPIYTDSFYEYDNVLFCDTDIFAVENLEENIFEGFTHDLGICTEPFQPKQRKITLGRITSEQDERWAKMVKDKWGVDVPRTEEGLVQVYNTGVVMYSNKGMQKCKERFVPFREYVDLVKRSGLNSFYQCDQPYLHTMMFTCGLDILEMDNNWNSYIHMTHDKINPVKRIVDHRTPDTKFVHIQFAGADNLDGPTLERIANLPQSEWKM